MKHITIHIRIGGRSYPAQIPSDREEVVRKAAREVEAQMQRFAQQFPGIDIQDQLALTALNSQTGLIDAENTAVQTLQKLEASLLG